MDRTYIYMAAVIVLIIAAAVVLVSLNSSKQSPLAAYDNVPVSDKFLSGLRIPQNISSAVAGGLAQNATIKINGSRLSADGKPEVLYVGADYCPFCAFTRWGLIIALMRFGNFTGLRYMTSSPVDYSPNAPSFTFSNATYTSNYIYFAGIETEGNKPIQGSYPPRYPQLEVPNATVNATVNAYDPSGGIPFIDFANQTFQVGANYQDITIIDNQNWTVIEGMLYNTSTADSRALVGTANYFTAKICMVDGNQPENVCGPTYIQNLEAFISSHESTKIPQ